MKKMFAKMVGTAIFAVVVGVSFAAHCEDKGVLEQQKNAPETYVAPMGMQFVRGIVNAATGWCEIPRQIVLSAEQDGYALAVPYGLPRGIFMTVARTFYGAMETAFFYIPFGGDGYPSAMDPAYVWQDKSEKK